MLWLFLTYPWMNHKSNKVYKINLKINESFNCKFYFWFIICKNQLYQVNLQSSFPPLYNAAKVWSKINHDRKLKTDIKFWQRNQYNVGMDLKWFDLIQSSNVYFMCHLMEYCIFYSKHSSPARSAKWFLRTSARGFERAKPTG